MTEHLGTIFADPQEKRAIKPADRLSVSAWVDEHRVLDQLHHSEPGPFRCDVTPYVRGILDAFGDRQTREIVLMCGTQVGKSETTLNALLWSVCEDPKPTLYVLPIEDDVAPFVLPPGRLASAIEACAPARARHRMTKEHEVTFEGMTLHFAWSNSPAKLASRSIGNLFLDEVDKYGAFAGGEADPISLARERLRWFPDHKMVAASTPTTTDGNIWRLWQRSDQRWFHVPCVFCGRFFRLEFFEVVRWPKDERDADKIREKRLATVRCPHCEREIADDAATKRRMLLGGVWCPEGGEVLAGGEVRGAKLDSKRKGFHINALYSPRLSWSDVAAEFLEAKDDHARLLNWTNSWRGWPWIEQSEVIRPEHLLALRTSLPAGVVAQDAVVLTAGVDVQKGLFYYAIRAWGVGERSWLVAAGSVERAESLCELLFHTAYAKESGEKLPVRLACIDSGYETDAVYDLCLAYPDIARPTKGHRAGRLSAGVPIRATRVRRDWIGRSTQELLLWNLDVTYFADKLARLMRNPLGGPGSWALHAEPSDEYLQHLLSEKKQLVRDKKKRTISYEWRAEGPNHMLDAERYAMAAAEMLGVWTLRDEGAAARAAEVLGREKEPERSGDPDDRVQEWFGDRPGARPRRSFRFGRRWQR